MLAASLVLALSAIGNVVASPAALILRQEASPTSEEVTTAEPSPTSPLDAKLPEQAPLPPKQAWCPSEIFCAGALLQTVNIAKPFGDSKTIVDKPTTNSANETLTNYNAFGNDTADITYGEVVTFLEQNFEGEGQELEALEIVGFQENPPFLNDLPDGVIRGFAKAVHSYWNLLLRDTNETTLCDGRECESSLIPLNHTFVVPGGRFREVYYWDTFFSQQGLLVSGLNEEVNSNLQNFMDFLECFGFIPNGGRIYYLNRSQPPFFIPMLHSYVNSTGDRGILTRALPLAEAELSWWRTNRSIEIESPYSNATRRVFHYSVTNSAPRPESYLPDYETANGEDIETPLNDTQKAALYAELASGAESGWDYSTRWMRNPFLGNETFAFPALRTLNVRATIPVDLNSILYKAYVDLANLYELSGNATAAGRHRTSASTLRTAIIDLFWNPDTLAFYDFNSSANARSPQLTAAHFYPLAFGIHPAELTANSSNAFKSFASVNLVINRYNGTYPATWLSTGQQWDSPNAWPPHQYIALEALRNLPSNVTGGPLPALSDGQTSWDLVPEGQLGIGEDKLPVQVLAGGNPSSGGDISLQNGTIVNGGTPTDGEGWAAILQRQLANRYFASALCSWHATGGSINGSLERLPDAELNVTNSVNLNGHMYEKYSLVDMDSAGRGGEYTVQAGFGWSNGVLLYVVNRYGDVLATPNCPPVVAFDGGSGGSGGNGGGGGGDAAVSLRASGITVVLAAVLAVFLL